MSDPKGAERPTPETDARAERGMLFAGGWYKKSGEYVDANHARTLERDRDALRERVKEAERQVSWLCSGGRFTDHEYQSLKREIPTLDGYTWNEKVKMWCRYDQDHWDALQRLATLSEAADKFRDGVGYFLSRIFSSKSVAEADHWLSELRDHHNKALPPSAAAAAIERMEKEKP